MARKRAFAVGDWVRWAPRDGRSYYKWRKSRIVEMFGIEDPNGPFYRMRMLGETRLEAWSHPWLKSHSARRLPRKACVALEVAELVEAL